MEEVFKKLTGTDYSVSNTGKVRNDKTNNILKPSLTWQGYYHVDLHGKICQLHVLVCTVWNGPKPFDKAVCRHLDDVKSNNIYTNLEWGTYKENGSDALANGRFNSFAKLTPEQVRYAREQMATGAYGTISRLIAELGVSRAQLGRIKAGKAWKLPA